MNGTTMKKNAQEESAAASQYLWIRMWPIGIGFRSRKFISSARKIDVYAETVLEKTSIRPSPRKKSANRFCTIIRPGPPRLPMNAKPA